MHLVSQRFFSLQAIIIRPVKSLSLYFCAIFGLHKNVIEIGALEIDLSLQPKTSLAPPESNRCLCRMSKIIMCSLVAKPICNAVPTSDRLLLPYLTFFLRQLWGSIHPNPAIKLCEKCRSFMTKKAKILQLQNIWHSLECR